MRLAHIYKITDLRNNMAVIGQTNGKNPHYYTSSQIINSILKKHGKKEAKIFLKKEIVVQGDFNQALLNELERHYVRLFNTKYPYGYNLTDGGDGASGYSVSHTEQTKLLLKKRWADNYEKRVSVLIENNINRVWSEEQKEKLRKANLGKKLSKEARDKMSKSRIGRIGHKWTEEEKITKSKNMKLFCSDPKQRKENSDRLKLMFKEGKMKCINRIPIAQYDKDGNFVEKHISILHAAKKLNVENGAGNITSCAKGKLKSAYGFIWRYVEKGVTNDPS